jgi:hypothetical protein
MPTMILEPVRFLVCPGPVTSKNDGDKHYITAQQLIRLYRLRPGTFYVYEEGKEYALDLIQCGPRYDGDYPDFSDPDSTFVQLITPGWEPWDMLLDTSDTLMTGQLGVLYGMEIISSPFDPVAHAEYLKELQDHRLALLKIKRRKKQARARTGRK